MSILMCGSRIMKVTSANRCVCGRGKWGTYINSNIIVHVSDVICTSSVGPIYFGVLDFQEEV